MILDFRQALIRQFRAENKRVQLQSRILAGKAQEKGLTLVPTKMYFKNGRVKLELGVGKGKKLYDKRETERKREADREARAAVKERSR